MVCSDTKLHAEIIKLLFWNFQWGHYVSVSHLDSVKVPQRTQNPHLTIELLHIYQNILDLSKEIPIGQGPAKV